MIPYRNKRCSHDDIIGFMNNLFLDICFILEGKNCVKSINHERLKTWVSLRPTLENCSNTEVMLKIRSHKEVIDFINGLIGRLYEEEWNKRIDFDRDVKPWYTVKNDLLNCTEPIIHY